MFFKGFGLGIGVMGLVDGIMSYELDGYLRIRLGVAFFGNDLKLLLSFL